MRLILLGAPGAGKGTQAEILSKLLEIPTISTGNILRAAMKAGTEVGLKAKAYVESGQTMEDMGIEIDCALSIEVEDEVIVKRMSGRRTCRDCSATFHVENNPPKAEGKCDFCGGELTIRKDDAPETVKNRLATYHRETEPLKAFYAERGKLREVQNQPTIEATTAAIRDCLGI